MVGTDQAGPRGVESGAGPQGIAARELIGNLGVLTTSDGRESRASGRIRQTREKGSSKCPG